jgi:cytochrome c biogenesis protein CcmG, thiol:disulfide interchange protein DsbE
MTAPDPPGLPLDASGPEQGQDRTATVSRSVVRRRLVWGGVGFITVAAIVWALLTPSAGPQQAEGGHGAPRQPLTVGPSVGHLAPKVTLLDLSNNHVALTSLSGKVVVLNFWYIACEPCRFEMPLFERVYHAEQGRGLVIVGVNIADDAQSISTFASQLGIDYPILRDQGHRAVLEYQVTATPMTFIIDRHGVIRARQVGPYTDTATLLAAVNPWLAST